MDDEKLEHGFWLEISMVHNRGNDLLSMLNSAFDSYLGEDAIYLAREGAHIFDEDVNSISWIHRDPTDKVTVSCKAQAHRAVFCLFCPDEYFDYEQAIRRWNNIWNTLSRITWNRRSFAFWLSKLKIENASTWHGGGVGSQINGKICYLVKHRTFPQYFRELILSKEMVEILTFFIAIAPSILISQAFDSWIIGVVVWIVLNSLARIVKAGFLSCRLQYRS